MLLEYSDATYTAHDVLEDPMMEVIAALLMVCHTAAGDCLDILAQMAAGFAPRAPEYDEA